MSGCVERLRALPQQLVWDRKGASHRDGGQPTDACDSRLSGLFVF